MTGIIILVLHILIVFITRDLIKKNLIRSDKRVIILVALVPIWGFVSVIFVTHLINTGRAGSRSGDLEMMREDEAQKEGSGIKVEEVSNVVPLEDALIMDDSTVRRSVIMDVLMGGADRYITVLDEARMNEDVEVVHYATTAMAELSKEYELKLQYYSEEYENSPDKEGLLDEYIDFLKAYIKSNMIQGQLLEIQRTTYQQLLATRISKGPDITAYADLVGSYLDSSLFSLAFEKIKEMEEIWPDNEELWKMRFRYFYEIADSKSMREMIDTVNSDRSGYSKEICDIVSLWDDRERTAMV